MVLILIWIVIAITVALIILIVIRPAITESRWGKIAAFLGFFILPVSAIVVGTAAHLEKSKSIDFCLACHVMEPYVRSLRIDDSNYVRLLYLPHELYDVRRRERKIAGHETSLRLLFHPRA
jgi:hypothetical protein